MGTIKPFNVDEMRSKASRQIYTMFKGAIEISAVYKDTFVKASCIWSDGVMEHVMMFYRDLDRRPMTYNQHDRAMQYINAMVG